MLKNMTIFCALTALTACGDPLSTMPRLSDVDLAETGPVAALPSEAELSRDAFFGTAATESINGLLTKPAPARSNSGSFLGNLQRAMQPTVRGKGQDTRPIEGAQTDDVIAEPVLAEPDPVLATVSPEPIKRRGIGLFDQLTRQAPAKPRTGADAMDVTYGTVLPYGVVARVCDARRQLLGQKVESASASGYSLHDSAPGSSGARTYYITGFDDNCPRQLTAAHVLLGAPSFYELLHYGPAGAHLAVGDTDRAYEQVKRRVCGAGKGKPCGAKMKSLERSTLFVNAYERMDDNTQWSELLVHDGAVVAASLKAN